MYGKETVNMEQVYKKMTTKKIANLGIFFEEVASWCVFFEFLQKQNGLFKENIATGETSQAITPFHFFDYFNFYH